MEDMANARNSYKNIKDFQYKYQQKSEENNIQPKPKNSDSVINDESESNEYFPDYITENLLFLGIMPKMSGFDYLREGIKLCFIDDDMLDHITSKLYPKIAEKFNTSSEVVERNMRNAINGAYKNGGLLNVNQYFDILIYKQDFKISNSEFISIILEKIKLDLLENTFKTHNVQN